MNVFIVLSLILISALVLIVAFWLMWKKVNRIEDTSNDCIRILEHQEIQLNSIVKSIEQLHIMAFGLSQKIEDNGVLSAELNEWLEYLKKLVLKIYLRELMFLITQMKTLRLTNRKVTKLPNL